MPIEYPTYPPKTIPVSLRGKKARIEGHGDGIFYTVDFATGECDCSAGAAWRWGGKQYAENRLCSHKLRAVASALAEEPSLDLRVYYDKSVGKLYNAFVAISAFHKELRRGDTPKALFWAEVMLAHRGRRHIMRYMSNIVYEETRDIALDEYLTGLLEKGDMLTAMDMQHAVARFAAAPKKWELPWRYSIFMTEMKAYRELADAYSYDVAKGSDIIPAAQYGILKRKLLRGFQAGSVLKVQTGLKGLLKLRCDNYDTLKIDLFNLLTDVVNGEHPNKFMRDLAHIDRLHAVIHRRIEATGGLGYHDINALADALTGETPTAASTLTKAQHRRVTRRPTLYTLPLGSYRRVPLYANDNHTWAGKALMRTFAAQLRPSAVQTDLDFRLCGAYMGVAWRTLAYKQGLTLDSKWGDVSFAKLPWLWKHLDKMWY